MTTAHRPTWKAAVAKESGGWTAGGAISTHRSVLDAPAHTQLKFRAPSAELRLEESLHELEQAEREQQKLKLASRRRNPEQEAELQRRAEQKLLTHGADKVDLLAIKAKYNDSDVEDESDNESSDGGGPRKKSNRDDESESDLDAASDLDASSSDSDSDEDDEDDEAALQAELAKIRAERDAAKSKEEQQRLALEEQDQQEAAMFGNPLLNLQQSTSLSKKRSWTEESVFRGQAKNEPKPQKRFINDTVRNDFHKRFLNKFIR